VLFDGLYDFELLEYVDSDKSSNIANVEIYR
jgi:hypothetical protein